MVRRESAIHNVIISSSQRHILSGIIVVVALTVADVTLAMVDATLGFAIATTTPAAAAVVVVVVRGSWWLL
mgnify:CR=1 FL=1